MKQDEYAFTILLSLSASKRLKASITSLFCRIDNFLFAMIRISLANNRRRETKDDCKDCCFCYENAGAAGVFTSVASSNTLTGDSGCLESLI